MDFLVFCFVYSKSEFLEFWNMKNFKRIPLLQPRYEKLKNPRNSTQILKLRNPGIKPKYENSKIHGIQPIHGPAFK